MPVQDSFQPEKKGKRRFHSVFVHAIAKHSFQFSLFADLSNWPLLVSAIFADGLKRHDFSFDTEIFPVSLNGRELIVQFITVMGMRGIQYRSTCTYSPLGPRKSRHACFIRPQMGERIVNPFATCGEKGVPILWNTPLTSQPIFRHTLFSGPILAH